MNNPIVQAIVYGLKRHWKLLVFLLMGVGALLFSLKWSGEKKQAHDEAESSYAGSQSSFKGADFSPTYKPVQENIDLADANVAKIDEFFDSAKGVLNLNVSVDKPTDFMRKLHLQIDRLNVMAYTNGVKLPNTATGAGNTNQRFDFTFEQVRTNTPPQDQIYGLALALHDIKNISELLLTSSILELRSMQRTRRVGLEDAGGGMGGSGGPMTSPSPYNNTASAGISEGTGPYLDDLEDYTNSDETLTGIPYRVIFTCYPEGLAEVLWRISTQPAPGYGIYVARSLRIETIMDDAGMIGVGPPGAGTGFGASPGSGGGPGFSPPGAVPAVDTSAVAMLGVPLAATGLGSRDASPVIHIKKLKVELHFDIIRNYIEYGKGREGMPEDGEGGFAGEPLGGSPPGSF
ncbi:MAG: hypothetical protein CMO66_03465 [Verrucomicrobiales bacterium]|nr:hypothetical protein [Verrucomicrobiales bacterium]